MIRETAINGESLIPRVALNCLSGVAPENGARVLTLALASALAELGGVDLVLLTAKGGRDTLPDPLRSIAREIDISAARSYWQIFRSLRIATSLRTERVSVLHLPNTLPCFFTGASTVITIFDLAELHAKRYGLLRTVYRWLVNVIGAHMANAVITISQNSKRDIVRYLRVNPAKITVIYPGVGEHFCPGDPGKCQDTVRQRFGTDRFLLFPGGIAKNKNIEGALHAFAHFRQLGGTQNLIITGRGEPHYVLSLRRVARRLKIDEQIIWTGCLDRDELPVFYRAADATLYPSLYEGFGLPILESMACGCPVVASNTSSLPEAAGDAAVLVDPRDTTAMARALREVVTNLALRQTLIERGLIRASMFSWTKTASETREVYRAASNTSYKIAALRKAYATSSERPSLES